MPLSPLLALLLARLPTFGALPPMALPSAPSPSALDRAEVDHVLVLSLAFLQMDSQPMVPLDQGLLPLSAQPGVDAAMNVARAPSGRCLPERSLLVVLDHRVPSVTQSTVEKAVEGACFQTHWLLVGPTSRSELAAPSAPVHLGERLAVVPYPMGRPAPPEPPAPQALELGAEGLQGQAPRLGAVGSLPAEGTPMILGELDAAVLMDAVDAENEAITACAQGAQGQLLLHFAVDAQGHPQGVRVQSSTMQDPEIGACIMEVVGGLVLPPEAEAQAVRLPVVLPAP